jgi:hypothetical protein
MDYHGGLLVSSTKYFSTEKGIEKCNVERDDGGRRGVCLISIPMPAMCNKITLFPRSLCTVPLFERILSRSLWLRD